ncbi:ATP-binding protein [Oscillatoria sp. FACHB-1406]|uniref:ATP-binding protein n=1 Tax=Oscillatoria sp. FACHB-1406 TaxID=2692846 RepID=UPI0016860A57|nr:ATP-binding protein [Oscillatoria sp. FACHB-1406]MBD2576321.1 hypothetical protein [Oscillatoria sp. FACHB-1406]
MNGRSSSVFSLYELALGESVRAPIVSRAVLESAIASCLDLLLETEITVTLWLKLPPTSQCWQEIAHYWTQKGTAESIYLLGEGALDRARELLLPAIALSWPSEIPEEWLFFARSPQLSLLIVARAQQRNEERYSLIWSADAKTIAPVEAALREAHPIGNARILASQQLLYPVPDPVRLSQILLSRLESLTRQQTPETISSLFVARGLQELSNTLTRMKTALSLLSSPALKLVQRQRYVALLQQECDRQNALIGGMQALVELEDETETAERLPLGDFVPSIVSTYQPLAMEKGIKLGYTIPAKLPPVRFPPNSLRQIILDILNNSLRFTPQNGSVSVRASESGDFVQLAFEDTGIGIAPQEVGKIFDCFYRGRGNSDNSEAGVGLGLTRVRQILLRYGGSIAVSSQVDRGSTFKVLLPKA